MKHAKSLSNLSDCQNKAQHTFINIYFFGRTKCLADLSSLIRDWPWALTIENGVPTTGPPGNPLFF